MRRRLTVVLAALCGAMVAGASILAIGVDGDGARPASAVYDLIAGPEEGEHVVLVVADPDGGRDDVGYVIDEIRTRGMGVALALAPAGEDELSARAISSSVEQLQLDPSVTGHSIALLAVGHGADDAWSVLAEPPLGVVAAVTINVPGIEGLDFADGLAVATLSLNVEADAATERHDDVHEAMAESGVLHQVIVYGAVPADALEAGSPGWDEATADDVTARSVDWLQHRDGFRNQSIENPHYLGG